MKLIVGLGNPGKKYERTRHNCGFIFLDNYIRKNNLIEKSKFNGLYYEQIINNEKIILLKPQTYMNLSGVCVKKFIDYFKISIENVLIIYDDVNYDLGKFKIRRNGSSGGHNGIKNIIEMLNTEEIKRVKIGISKNNIPLEDYVLKKLTDDEYNKIMSISDKINNIIIDFISNSIEYIMEKYNGK